jgi:2-methylaconitate cis-trans-isomerase PrpF
MTMSKTLKSIEQFTNESDKKVKFCVNCGNIASHTACFSVEDATVIERYCVTCVKTLGTPAIS